jgi:phage protein D
MSKKKVAVVEVAVVTAQKGRPVNPTSARQLRLKELAEKKANGELKRGRPVVEASARQKRLAELEAKKANGELKRGRPSNQESARQKRLAELRAKAEMNGGVVPKGRPSMKAKVEEVIIEVVKETIE